MNELKTVELLRPAGILLAAGASSRMGKPKQNLPFGTSYLASQSLEQALTSQLQRIIVVVSRPDDDFLIPFSEELASGRLEIAHCTNACLGQSASLQCGIRMLKQDEHAFMVLLADQPFITAPMIDELIHTYIARSHEAIEFASYRFQHIPRPPSLFSVTLVPHMEKLEGDKGARGIISPDSPHKGVYLEWHDAGAFTDIDTWQDYQAITIMK